MDASRTCPICGESFPPHRANQVYCSAECRAKHKQKDTSHSNVCPICGKGYTTINGNQRYCSPDCRREADRRRKEAYRSRYERVCEHCGKHFTTGTKNKKFCCHECQLAAKTKRDKDERHSAREWINQQKERRKPKKSKGLSLIERYSAYRAAGGELSYGYWVALGCPAAPGQLA